MLYHAAKPAGDVADPDLKESCNRALYKSGEQIPQVSRKVEK